MKINFKKIAIGVASLLVILVAFVSINLITNKKNRTTEYDSNKLFPVKILFADKDKVPKDVSLDDFFFKYDYTDALIYAMSSDLPLIDKEDNYYVLDLKKYINSDVLSNLTAETFAKYNLYGEEVNDIKYDKNTKILKIPTSYYDENDNKNTQIKVQAEFIDVTTKTALQNTKVKLKTTNFLTSNKIIKLNGMSSVTQFSIAKYNNKKKLTRSDIDIYINNSKNKIPTENFEYDSKTGVVSFNYPVAFIDSIDVDIKKNLLSSFLYKTLNIDDVEAASGPVINQNSRYTLKLKSAPTIPSNYADPSVYIYTKNESGPLHQEGFESHYIFDITDTSGKTVDPMFYKGRGTPWSYQVVNPITRIADDRSYNGALNEIISGNAGLADRFNTYHAVEIGNKLEHNGFKLEFDDNNLWLNLDCVHIDQTVTTPNTDFYVGYNIKVIDYDPSQQYVTLAFLSQNSGGDMYNPTAEHYTRSQAAWGVYTFSWNEDDKQYITIQKDFNPDMSDAEKEAYINAQGTEVYFLAHPYENNSCDMNQAYGSIYDSTTKLFYIYGTAADNQNKHPNLSPGQYCIEEKNFHDGYEPVYNGETVTQRVEGEDRTFGLVTLSAAVNPNDPGESTTPVFFGDESVVSYCTTQLGPIPGYGSDIERFCKDVYDGPITNPSNTTVNFGLHARPGSATSDNTDGKGYFLAMNGARLVITDYEQVEGQTNNSSIDYNYRKYLNLDSTQAANHIKKGTPVIVSIGNADLNDSKISANTFITAYRNKITAKLKDWYALGVPKVYLVKVSGTSAKHTAFNNALETMFDGTFFDSMVVVKEASSLTNGEFIFDGRLSGSGIIDPDLLSPNYSGNTDGFIPLISYRVTNNMSKYCIRVRKVDAESPSTGLNGFTFALKSGSSTVATVTTATVNGTKGIGVFNNLSYRNYTLTETSPDGTDGYWTNKNNNSNSITVKKTDLTPMDCTGTTCVCPSSDVKTYTKKNNKQYYCIKVKKVDANTGEALKGASFKTTIGGDVVEHSDNWDGSEDGYTTFFTGTHSGNFNVIETVAPAGYSIYDGTLVAKAKLMSREKTSDEAEAECKTADPSTFSSTSIPSFPDHKNLINWYKVTEDETTRANGAKFKVKQKNGTKYIKVNGTETVTDSSNPSITKKCYKFNSLVDSESEASTLTSYDISEAQDGSMKGEVCISGMPKGTYTVIETKPAEYHTFSDVYKKDITTSTKFLNMTDSNKLVNLPTEFEFDKYVTSGDDADWSSITTEMLKLIEFNVYDSDGNLVEFIKISDGTYVYAGNDIDGTSGTRVTGLYLGDDRKIHIKHLPKGTYSIKEKIDNNNGSCDCTLDGSCIGFFGPTYETESEYKFTITDCSNPNAHSGDGVCDNPSITIKWLNNTPTEIKFTKSDLYSYEDASDIVDFENDQERNDFDRIVFKLKDENGNYLRLVKVRNVGTCLTDDSYAEYRYVPEDMIDSLTEEQRANLTEELYTCGGHIRITHLCRGKKYYIEEVSVPENSVFTLPESVEARTREYTIPCCGEGSSTTTTAIIEDTPTRVRFEKRDSKYNYLIPDETTTFQVYQCKKGTTCHPADGITSDMKLIKFSPRAVIDGDREDPTDVAGLEGVEVYKAMSDSDAASGKEFVTDLHPYHGILVLRYLSSGYNYVLLETKAPKNYTLPRGRAAETSFTVVNNTVNVDVTDMPNTPTGLIIRKYSDDGRLLTGARFKIYEGTTCDSHLTPMNQPKRELKVKTIRDGLYEARPVEDTNVIETCNNKNGICSSIPVDQVTSLTYTTYLGTWADFDNAINDRQEKVQLQEGEALIQYLEYGHCYIIEEIKAPDGYSLPKNVEDRFTMVTLDENERYIKDTYKTLVNTPTPFTFYKYDEYNQLLDGAEFKLQKLDKNKIYQDVTVTQVEKNGELYYKVDENSTNKTITTRGGKATIYYLSTGQYRVLETKAAPGKELSKNPNIATFFVDDSGNVYGDGIIINKAKTEKIEVKSSSSAEYIVGINTGQQVIRYGLIVAVLILGITGLIILNKKSK